MKVKKGRKKSPVICKTTIIMRKEEKSCYTIHKTTVKKGRKKSPVIRKTTIIKRKEGKSCYMYST